MRLIEQRDISMLYEICNEEEVKKYDGDYGDIPDKRYVLSNFSRIRKVYRRGLSIINDRDVLVGCVRYEVTDKEKRIYSIGITIGSMFWNKGYGKDTLRVLSEYLFDDLNAEVIQLEVIKDNKRAINCYKSAGFREEYVKNKSYNLRGTYVDTIVMTLEKLNLNREII
ncbi:GNAT family N-acetyltransferase [Clostridium paraputrificum]